MKHDILIKNDDAYYDTETTDKGTELAAIKLDGPIAHAPDGFCWEDGETTRRVSQSGSYNAFNKEGEPVILVVKLHGFGTRDKFPGEKTVLSPKQKSVMNWKERQAEKEGRNVANKAGFSADDGF